MTEVESDPTRPFFQRPSGEVGIYIDAYEADAINPKDYGSEHCFLMELNDKLYEQFTKVPFDVIKGGFERRGILDGVIIEKLHKCNVFSCSFENAKAIENMWQAYEDDKIGPVMHEVLSTPDLAEAVGAKRLILRTRMYEDEADECKEDMRNNRKAKIDFESDRLMLGKIKHYQKDLAETILTLREDFGRFESTLGDFTLILKRNLSSKVQQISSFEEFLNHYQMLKEKKVNNKCFESYIKVRKSLAAVLQEVDAMLCHRLAQVHKIHETPNQQKIKQDIKERRQTAIDRLKPEFNFLKLRHLEWVSKIVLREHKLFLGLVSVVALGVDTVVDVDQMIDEYISGFTDYKV